MKHTLRATLVALCTTLALALLGGCGASDHNEADVSFAQEMIPHHRQAVAMAKLAATHDAGPGVRALAARIEKAQAPEIEQMTGWLHDWGSSSHGSMSMDDMPGMMSDGDMSELMNARGDAFDRLFLTQMIAHHQGAIEMAKKEQSDGSSDDAVTLAGRIEKAQTSEIAEMRTMLG